MFFRIFVVVVFAALAAFPAFSASNENDFTKPEEKAELAKDVPSFTEEKKDAAARWAKRFSIEVFEAQVLLDRALFSPGEIDGVWGNNARAALNMFQEVHHLKRTDEVDDATSEALMLQMPSTASKGSRLDERASFLAYYRITKQDAEGPFFEIPSNMMKQADLPEMGYKNMVEKLGERFHARPEALIKLNPSAKWKAGEEVLVPNISPSLIESKNAEGMAAALEKKNKMDKRRAKSGGEDEFTEESTDEVLSSGLSSKPTGPVTVIASKRDGDLTVRDKSGKIIFFAPITTGSEHDPLPLGEWKINGTERYPLYHYNPTLFWDSRQDDKETKVQPGPNNPVGVAWIDLSKPHYGMHGTPEPGKIGYTESHGCVRLTNWDALRLADMVKPGTKVFFINESQPPESTREKRTGE